MNEFEKAGFNFTKKELAKMIEVMNDMASIMNASSGTIMNALSNVFRPITTLAAQMFLLSKRVKNKRNNVAYYHAQRRAARSHR